MSFLQFLLMGATYSLIGYGAYRVITAAKGALKETRVENRRFIESLGYATRHNLSTMENAKVKVDKDGNYIVTFELDNHLFKIVQPSNLSSLSCTGFHREYYQQVLHFTYSFSSKTSQKQISSQIIRHEEKDIRTVDNFIQAIISKQWANISASITNNEKKDYTLVEGSINNGTNKYDADSISDIHNIKPLIASIRSSLITLPSTILKESYEVVLTNVERLFSSNIPLDAENQHNIERLVRKELTSMHKNFLALSSENQEHYEPVVQKSLEIMNKYITLLLLENEKRHITNLEVQLRLNEENYKK
ncbi:hypothetical protein CN918_32025 [Priestia megaterium]|nr:hypothetical protein CN918_32025 [Priestia megaterium]